MIQQHGRHSRLPTNRLLLVSRSGFTPEAERIAAEYNISTTTFEAFNERSVERLLDTESLWAKVGKIVLSKVTFRVNQTHDLPEEDVEVAANLQVYDEAGKPSATAAAFVDAILKAHGAAAHLLAQVEPEHREFEMEVGPPVTGPGGMAYCLQRIDSSVLRRIAFIRVRGTCEVHKAVFRLEHGKLGDLRVAWGKSELLGHESLIVVSDDGAGGKKVSIDFTRRLSRPN